MLPAFLPIAALFSILLLPSVNANVQGTSKLHVKSSDILYEFHGAIYEVKVEGKPFALKLMKDYGQEWANMQILQSELTADEQENMMLPPSGFQDQYDVVLDGTDVGKGFLLPIFEKGLPDYIQAKATEFKDGDKSIVLTREMVRFSIQIARSWQVLHKHNICLGPFHVLLKRCGSELSAALTGFEGLQEMDKDDTANPAWKQQTISGFGSMLKHIFPVSGSEAKHDPNTMPGSLIERCYAESYEQRPTADELVEELSAYERELVDKLTANATSALPQTCR